MFGYWLPKPMYNAIPYTLVLSGAGAVLSTEHTIGTIAGGILITLGTLIFFLRAR